MKKTLRLILLAVAAVALLTSCDAMLESLFPADTVGTGIGSNTLTVNITGYDYSSAYPGYWGYTGLNFTYYAKQPIYVEVYDQYGNKIQDNLMSPTHFLDWSAYASYTYVRKATPVVFNGLKDGTYTFKVWYAEDGNNDPIWEATYTNGWYYTDYVYLNGGYASTVYLPNNGQTSTTVDAYLWEVYPY